MQTTNIHAAKTQFPRLVDQAEAGKEIVIARAGEPVAKLVPVVARPAALEPVLGGMAGRLVARADFDAPLPGDLLDEFEGR